MAEVFAIAVLCIPLVVGIIAVAAMLKWRAKAVALADALARVERDPMRMRDARKVAAAALLELRGGAQ